MKKAGVAENVTVMAFCQILSSILSQIKKAISNIPTVKVFYDVYEKKIL
jgi:hypothetical protein